jgi:tellurite resistance protein TerC
MKPLNEPISSHVVTKRHVHSLKGVKRVIVAVVGTTVILIGVALIVLPGPAFVVIPAGLAILATEFAWAERWLSKAKAMFNKARGKKP